MPQREDGQYRKQENYIFLFRLSPSKATCGFLFYTSVVFYCFLQLHPVSLSSKTLILVLLHPYLNPKSSLCTTPLSLFSLCTSLLLISSFVFVYHTLICHLSPVFSFLSPPPSPLSICCHPQTVISTDTLAGLLLSVSLPTAVNQNNFRETSSKTLIFIKLFQSSQRLFLFDLQSHASSHRFHPLSPFCWM